MKNLDNKIQVLNENRGETSLFEYVEATSQSDPNFFRWLFSKEFDNDFNSSMNDEQKSEFATWLEEIRVDELFEKYIVVSFDPETEDRIRITKRDNFEKVNMCDCYAQYDNKISCYDAGCYSFDNSDSSCRLDCKAALVKEFPELDRYTIDVNADGSVEFVDEDQFEDLNERNLLNDEAYASFIKNWIKENETHTEVTAWTFHDSHNFKSVVLDTDFGEPDCTELDEDEQRAILAEYPGFPHIEGTNASEETENYIFSFDLWATNPWTCYVEKK